MEKQHQKIVKTVIKNLDWDSISRIHESFKYGVGQSNQVLPGMKRKDFSQGITKKDIQDELNIVLQYVIENDYQTYIYGPWIISWYNQEWGEKIIQETKSNGEEELDIEIEVDQDSKLEVAYAPQRICVTMNTEIFSESPASVSESTTLQKMLDNAISQEKYEIAQKIQEILKMTEINS
ncbi:hypothetical protein EBS02_06060 [bacterium]|nr:hypothetical protein [bacterium]